MESLVGSLLFGWDPAVTHGIPWVLPRVPSNNAWKLYSYKTRFQVVESREFPLGVPRELSGNTEGDFMVSQVRSLIFRWDPAVSHGIPWIRAGNT